MSPARKTRQAASVDPLDSAPRLTTGDILAYMAHCVHITAILARALEANGHCAPELHESLKGIQLNLDRQVRSLAKRGRLSAKGAALVKAVSELPDYVPPQPKKPPRKTRAKMSPPSISAEE